MAKSTAYLRRKADRLLQDHYTAKWPLCFVCGSQTTQIHHFIPKSQSNYLRYNRANLIPLCTSCHFKHHRLGDPEIIRQILMVKGTDWFDELQTLRHRIQKPTKAWYKEVIKKLEE
jgi:5-methylcytosine-specific restriction endonuclease McrA